MPTDVTDAEQCDQVVAVTVPEFGQVDVAVNNAGGASTKAPLDWEADEWSQIVDLNLAGVYFLSRAAAKRKLEGGKGVIVNISSGSSCNPFPIGLPYGASKAAVNNLTNFAGGRVDPARGACQGLGVWWGSSADGAARFG